jgi:hypothetical protein
MNRILRVAVYGVLCAGAVTIAWRSGEGRAEDQPNAPPAAPVAEEGREDLPLREYMRAKLEASNKVLEGLCVDDPAMVKEGAVKLNEMSQSERWRVSNDAMYRQFSGDFREITQQLVDAADEQNMDRAALKWMDATMSCIECHRFVRGIMIAEEEKAGE